MKRDEVSRLAVGQLVNLAVLRAVDGARWMGALSNCPDPVAIEGEHGLGAHARDDSEGAARSPVVVDRAGLARTPAQEESLVARPFVQPVATVPVWIEAEPSAQRFEIDIGGE